jgi:nicotinamide-nucleotide amidase
VKAEIIATGSELLVNRTDRNSLVISKHLASIGIEVRFITIVGDHEEDLEDALQRSQNRANLTIVTGGLGATDDDITKKVVSRVTNKRLTEK